MKKLIQYIESHEGCEAREEGGKLLVTCDAFKDGRDYRHSEVIEPEIEVVRAWLGY